MFFDHAIGSDMQDRNISAEEFSHWIPMAQALSLLPNAWTPANRQRWIADRMTNGLVLAATSQSRSAQDGLATLIPPEWWKEARISGNHFWNTGDITISVDDGQPKHAGWEPASMELLGVKLDPVGFYQTLGDSAIEWVDCANAVSELASRFEIAARVVCKKLADLCAIGHLRAHCGRFERTLDERSDDEPVVEFNVEISPIWWKVCFTHPDAVLDYESGTFSGKGFVDREDYRIKAEGISFEAHGLRAFKILTDEDAAGRKLLETTPRGGRRPYDYWEDAVVAVSGQLFSGDLQPKKQADIEAALADWLTSHGHSASESSIRKRGRKLWQAIQK